MEWVFQNALSLVRKPSTTARDWTLWLSQSSEFSLNMWVFLATGTHEYYKLKSGIVFQPLVMNLFSEVLLGWPGKIPCR